MHFSKKSGRLSSTGPEILAFSSHRSVNFLPILDCFIPHSKLKYEDSESVKRSSFSTYIKSNRGTFLDTQWSDP